MIIIIFPKHALKNSRNAVLLNLLWKKRWVVGGGRSSIPNVGNSDVNWCLRDNTFFGISGTVHTCVKWYLQHTRHPKLYVKILNLLKKSLLIPKYFLFNRNYSLQQRLLYYYLKYLAIIKKKKF